MTQSIPVKHAAAGWERGCPVVEPRFGRLCACARVAVVTAAPDRRGVPRRASSASGPQTALPAGPAASPCRQQPQEPRVPGSGTQEGGRRACVTVSARARPAEADLKRRPARCPLQSSLQSWAAPRAKPEAWAGRAGRAGSGPEGRFQTQGLRCPRRRRRRRRRALSQPPLHVSLSFPKL